MLAVSEEQMYSRQHWDDLHRNREGLLCTVIKMRGFEEPSVSHPMSVGELGKTQIQLSKSPSTNSTLSTAVNISSIGSKI